MARARFHCWLDLEATGRDEYLDPILEVGVVLTEAYFPFNELACFEAVCFPEQDDWRDRMDAFVTTMHTENGLIDDVEARGRPIEAVEEEMIALLKRFGRPHEFMIAGSAVSHYDRAFIRAQMPTFNKWLQPPSFDVGTVRRFLRFAGRGDLDAYGQTFQDGDKPHRGLADVRDHLNEMREYASLVQLLPEES